MDAEDLVPVLFFDVVESAVTQDAGVGDDDVHLAEGVDCGLDDVLAAGVGVHAVVVGDGLAAGGLDLLDDLVGHRSAAAAAVARAAEVVDDDLGAARSQEQRVGAAQTAAGACDDGDPVVKSYFAQLGTSSQLWGRPAAFWGRADSCLLGSLLNSHSVGSVNAPGRPADGDV